MIAAVPALIDVNVALALIDGDHGAHAPAAAWLQEQPTGGVVLVRVVQLGLLRLLNSAVVMRGIPLTMEECWQTWQQVLRDERFRFVTNEPGGIESAFKKFTSRPDYSPKRWTDAYLASFALAGQYTLVSFDGGLKEYPELQHQVLETGSPNR
jgi:toxin-antitoxin system PIN domain toxin